MSLYFDAASILTDRSQRAGSFVSRVYNAQGLKSPPKQVSALIYECAKFDIVLKEVIESAGILPLELKVS
jgi:putative methyltransferase